MGEEPTFKVVVAVIRDEGRFVVAKRDEKGKLPGQWEFPGGAVSVDASPEEGLKDHLAKRFNLDVVVGDRLGTTSHEYDFGKVEVSAYFVECISKKLKLTQHMAYRWIRIPMLKDFEMVTTAWPLVELLKQQSN